MHTVSRQATPMPADALYFALVGGTSRTGSHRISIRSAHSVRPQWMMLPAVELKRHVGLGLLLDPITELSLLASASVALLLKAR